MCVCVCECAYLYWILRNTAAEAAAPEVIRAGKKEMYKKRKTDVDSSREKERDARYDDGGIRA